MVLTHLYTLWWQGVYFLSIVQFDGAMCRGRVVKSNAARERERALQVRSPKLPLIYESSNAVKSTVIELLTSHLTYIM